jgi:phospho-N-acetylmuramoyl-pentapeptide-transferase
VARAGDDPQAGPLKGGQPIRKDGPQSHFSKAGTPTMGGALILLAIARRCCCGPTCATATSGCAGGDGRLRRDRLVDDWIKIVKRDPNGLSRAGSTLLQSIFGWPPPCMAVPPTPTCRRRPPSIVPFFKIVALPLGGIGFVASPTSGSSASPMRST